MGCLSGLKGPTTTETTTSERDLRITQSGCGGVKQGPLMNSSQQEPVLYQILRGKE